MKSQNVGVGQVGDRDLCVEQAVTLASRLGACLINARLVVSRWTYFFLFSSLTVVATPPVLPSWKV